MRKYFYKVEIDERSVPTRFGSRYVDPATVIAVVEGVTKYMAQTEQKNWQALIGDKLDEISAKLNQVLTELRSLRVYIHEEINNALKYLYKDGILAAGLTLSRFKESELGGAVPKERQQLAFDLFYREIVANANKVVSHFEWGFPLYEVITSAFAYGVLAHRLAPKLISKKDVTDQIGIPAYKHLSASISESPEVFGTFPSYRNAAKIEFIKNILALEQFTNRWICVSDVRNYRGPGGDGEGHDGPKPSHIRVAFISGSFDAGYSYRESLVVDQNDPRFGSPYYPGFPGHIEPHEEEKARLIVMNDILSEYVRNAKQAASEELSLGEIITFITNELAGIKKWCGL